jgi:N-acetyl-gamma-glutamyl-phosphate reductase
VRLLVGHPALSLVIAGAASSAGRDLTAVHPHLAGATTDVLVPVAAAAATPVDVCFSCLPSGALGGMAGQVAAELVIDLADDHRAAPGWHYGLVEHARGETPGATRIANPGCYPTATLLGLVPFARAGLIGSPIVVDALSGVSGAGKNLDEAYLFSAMHGSATAYGTTTHRHVPEMERGLAAFAATTATISFTPHLVPMARGLLVTARAPLSAPLGDTAAVAVLQDAYASEHFITVVDDWPATKAVVGTNRALISARVDARAGMLVVSVAIDNLGKGAAGQAIQNANVAVALDETSGLEGVATWP